MGTLPRFSFNSHFQNTCPTVQHIDELSPMSTIRYHLARSHSKSINSHIFNRRETSRLFTLIKLWWHKSNLSPFVDNFQVFPLQERAHLRLSRQNCCDKLSCYLLLYFVLMCNIPFLQAQLALTWEQEHELHLRMKILFERKTGVVILDFFSTIVLWAQLRCKILHFNLRVK